MDHAIDGGKGEQSTKHGICKHAKIHGNDVGVDNQKNHDGTIEERKRGTHRSMMKHGGHPVYMPVFFAVFLLSCHCLAVVLSLSCRCLAVVLSLSCHT
jgi:hypothetical protein